jgi:hypothetical protein
LEPTDEESEKNALSIIQLLIAGRMAVENLSAFRGKSELFRSELRIMRDGRRDARVAEFQSAYARTPLRHANSSLLGKELAKELLAGCLLNGQHL